MKPPRKEEAAPCNKGGSLRVEDEGKVLAFRAEIKTAILTALTGKVMLGSDFEVRRLRARRAAEQKEKGGSSHVS